MRPGWVGSGDDRLVGQQVPGAGHVQRDAGAHRRRHGALDDVATLGGRRLEAEDLLERSGVVPY